MRTLKVAMAVAGLTAGLAAADIITGKVTDADDGLPLQGVRIGTGATNYTFSKADGTYELNTATTAAASPTLPAKMEWDARAQRFRWEGAHGDVRIEVRDVRGNVVDRHSSGSSQGGSYSLKGLGTGVHVVTVDSKAGIRRFRAFKVGDQPIAIRDDWFSGPGLLAKVAAATVTYAMANYEPQTKQTTASPAAVDVALKAAGGTFTADNGLVQLVYTKAGGAITARHGGFEWLKSAQLSQAGGTARYMEDVTENNLKGGKGVEITHADGNKDRILVFPNSQFVYFKKWIGNKGGSDRNLEQINQVRATVAHKGGSAATLKAAGTATSLTNGPGQKSYHFLALGDPSTRSGLVGAWVTNNVASGIVEGAAAGSDATLTGISEFGQLNVKPGQTKECDMFAVGWFEDATLGLEANSNDIARAYDIKMRPNQVVFCTWQSVGGEGTPSQMSSTSDWLGKNLVKYGYSVAQIDDGWQRARRRFDGANSTWTPAIKPTADKIKSDGMMAGLWYMPFAGTAGDAYFSPWFLKDKNGGVETSSWANTSLDVTLPDVKTYIKRVTDLIYKDWGYQYFKIDGMFTGLGAHQNYTNDAYKTDDFFFNSRPSDKYKTNVEAYRDAWAIIRNAAPDAFIMGCTITQNMRTLQASFGIMDALRIGPDGYGTWNDIVGKGLIRSGRRYFYNGRVFWVDPDPVYPDLPFGRMICTYNAFVGYMYTAIHTRESGSFTALSADEVNIFKRTMPYHGALNVRPADFFERANPGIWLLTDSKSGPRRDVIGLFNWDQNAGFPVNYPAGRLGLDGSAQYIGFDFWANALVGPFSGNVNQVVGPAGTKIISVRKAGGEPMVLSTNRHVADPVYSVEKESWNGSVLSGASKVVGGDDYELRIYAAKGAGQWTAGNVTVDGGATIAKTQDGNLVRVTIKSATNKTVNWTVAFN